jgi:Arc/MetJ-type ribon-helix-helix transcriptional regulator
MGGSRPLSVYVPYEYHVQIEKLIKNGRFTSKSEALRHAVKKLIEENNHKNEELPEVFDIVKQDVLLFLEEKKRILVRRIAKKTGLSAVRVAVTLNYLINYLREKWRVEG